MKTEIEHETKLRWPSGWDRRLIELRKPAPSWKKPLEYYDAKVIKQLTMMGATAILITHAPVAQERLDPGVAVWFSLVKEDYSWQTMLGLGPAPRKEEIIDAFQQKAKQVHPDRQDGKADIEMFKRLNDARQQAIAWIEGRHKDRHEFVLCLDHFSTVKGNLAGLAITFEAFRRLQSMGMPSILERALDKAFKAALPMPEGNNAAA